MNLKLLQLLQLLFLSFLTSSYVRSAPPSSPPLLGASPDDEKYFLSASHIIKCRDGSKKINRSRLNDDFCDCPDGSDEPGTSACPNGRFYCRNAGHVPLNLFSSRVNDGICDCCDGSDEYDGKIKCPNTCWEAGKAARDKLKKKIATYQQGAALRKKEVENSKLAFAKDEAELSKLKDEEKLLKKLVQQLKDRKEQIEKAEEKERLEKEKEEKLRKAEKESNQEKEESNEVAESKEDQETRTGDFTSSNDNPLEQDVEEIGLEVKHDDGSDVEGLSSNAADVHAKETNEELEAVSESGTSQNSEDIKAGSENTEGLSKEELGRLVASRWTGEKVEKTEDTDPKDENAEVTPKDVHEDDYDGYGSEYNDDDHKYDGPDDAEDHEDDDFTEEDHVDSPSYKSDSEDESYEPDLTTSSKPTWMEKVQNTFKNILQAVNVFQAPLNISDAASVRKEYDESSAKLSKMQSRISSLSDKLKLDFGPELEFYSFHGQCFESKQNKYVYKICPFKKATQDEGHSSTRLGQWDKFEDSFKVMAFSNGDKCWNGPDRSMKVRLRCGLKNEVTDVDEPSRCEYVALLSTPSVCHEEKLKELQQKLDGLNQQQPPNHDEL